MVIVTLIGSNKQREEFDRINRILTLRGYVVFSLGVWDCDDPKLKPILTKVHAKKIGNADYIVIIRKSDGSIGEHTSKEIEIAKAIGKSIFEVEEILGEKLL